mgnify:CR=1 FL=1
MARFFPLIWTDPAIDDLDEIAAWIALERPRAAEKLVTRVFARVERLTLFPESGRRVPELPRETIYREVVVPPCRVFYRMEGRSVLIVHVRRSERELDPDRLP